MKKVSKEGMRVSIYQVLPRLFGNSKGRNVRGGSIEENGSGKLDHFTSTVLKEIADLGCTHVWYTGVIEHATGSAFRDIPADHSAVLKGVAGSPYAISDYFDIAPSLAVDVERRQMEFDDLVARTHQAGLGVLIDFVPNHVSRVYHSDARPGYIVELGNDDDVSVAFDRDNNFYYLPCRSLTLPNGNDYTEYPAKATGNDVFHSHPSRHDWYETIKLNYGVDYIGGSGNHFDPIPNTWKKMFVILNYWANRGVDGFRCDMAEMVPPEFWSWAIGRLRRSFPQILFIGEVYQPHLYQTYLDAGFDYLYDKVGLYDTLVRVLKGEARPSAITYAWQSLPVAKERVLHFMENHDEQRLASDFIAGSGERAFPAMVVSALMDSSALMTYFGQELGERGMDEEGFSGLDGRTTIFDYWRLDTIEGWLGSDRTCRGEGLTEAQRALRQKYQRLLRIARDWALFMNGGFFDLMYANQPIVDRGRVYAFLRASHEEVALVVVNFSDEREQCSVTLPRHAFDTLQFEEGYTWQVEELLRGGKSVALLESTAPYTVEVPANDAVVYNFHRPER